MRLSARSREPSDIGVGSICRLLSPGEPDEKRCLLKPRHETDESTRFIMWEC